MHISSNGTIRRNWSKFQLLKTINFSHIFMGILLPQHFALVLLLKAKRPIVIDSRVIQAIRFSKGSNRREYHYLEGDSSIWHNCSGYSEVDYWETFPWIEADYLWIQCSIRILWRVQVCKIYPKQAIIHEKLTPFPFIVNIIGRSMTAMILIKLKSLYSKIAC